MFILCRFVSDALVFRTTTQFPGNTSAARRTKVCAKTIRMLTGLICSWSCLSLGKWSHNLPTSKQTTKHNWLYWLGRREYIADHALHIQATSVERGVREKTFSSSHMKQQTDGGCQILVTAVNRHSCAPLKLLVNINERCMPCKRPYLFSYLLSEPGNRRWASINITLSHPQGSALFLLDVNDFYTCACGGGPPHWTSAIAHDGAGPQARTQLASQTSRHLLRVGWATALKGPAACGDLLLDTGCFFSHPGTLFYRLSEGLIRVDMLSVLGWTDIAVAGVCVCVCVWDTFCIISSRVKDYSNKHLYVIPAQSFNWNKASWVKIT